MNLLAKILSEPPLWLRVPYEVCMWTPVLLPVALVLWKKPGLRRGAVFVLCATALGYGIPAVLFGAVVGLALVAGPLRSAIVANGLQENGLVSALFSIPEWFHDYWFLLLLGHPIVVVAWSILIGVLGRRWVQRTP
jgi:hypothetical protein